MAKELIFKWAEAYFQCMVKKGEVLSMECVINILNDKWKGCIHRNGFNLTARAKRPYLISNDKKGKDRTYTNTLGDHYGEKFPRRVLTEHGFEYVFEK